MNNRVEPMVVDMEYLMAQLNLPEPFIKRHARLMGSIGCRPRRFLLSAAIAFIKERAAKNAGRVQERAAKKAEHKTEIKRFADSFLLRRLGRSKPCSQ